MKTKVEIEGYEIEIEFVNGVISVKAEKDDEVVEEFSIEVEEGQGESQDEEEVQDFREFGQDEEEDFEGEEDESSDDLEDELEGEDDEDEDEVREPIALESFQSFINKNKK